MQQRENNLCEHDVLKLSFLLVNSKEKGFCHRHLQVQSTYIYLVLRTTEFGANLFGLMCSGIAIY